MRDRSVYMEYNFASKGNKTIYITGGEDDDYN